MIWHNTDAESVAKELGVSPQKGLSTGEADERLARYGENLTAAAKQVSTLQIIREWLSSFVNILVIISAAVTAVVCALYRETGWYTPILILAMLGINLVMSIFIQKRCQKSLNAVRRLSVPKARVLRDGIEKEVEAAQVVPGDILLLETGDYVTADARIVESVDLRANEALVTGESVPVKKSASDILEELTPASRRSNFVFAGSSIANGSAKAVVTETGTNTYVGKTVTIFEQFDSVNVKLKSKLAAIGKISSIILLIVCLLIFILGVAVNFRTQESFAVLLTEMFLNSVVLLITALAEGLPILSGIAMSLSVERLLRRGLVVKDLSAFDSLPSTTVICADKTGIFTENNMEVVRVCPVGQSVDAAEAAQSPAAASLLKLAALCTNQSEDDRESPLYGDPTELAIIENCRSSLPAAAADSLFSDYPRLSKIPFDADTKIMVSINMIDGRPVLIAKGSPGEILNCCTSAPEEIRKDIEGYAAQSMRIIAVAFKPLASLPAIPTADELLFGLNFAGFLALYDTPRKDNIKAVSECKAAGIRTCLITGDGPVAAAAFSKRIGILQPNDPVLTGPTMAELSDDELADQISEYTVFAATSPRDKERIVAALQANAESVVLTGDCVEEAAALKKADVSFAMGNTGTDVARGASDIIMYSTGFSSIVRAIRSSRSLLSGIRKTLTYLFSSNIGEVLCVLLGVIIFDRFPVSAIGLLLINLLTDIFPVYSILTDELAANDPLKKVGLADRPLIPIRHLILIVVQAIVIAVTAICGFSLGRSFSPSVAETAAFTVLCLGELLNMMTCKSIHCSYKRRQFVQPLCNLMLLGSLVLLLLIVLTPIGLAFGIAKLSFSLFFRLLLLSLLVPIAGEITKAAFWLYHKLAGSASPSAAPEPDSDSFLENPQVSAPEEADSNETPLPSETSTAEATEGDTALSEETAGEENRPAASCETDAPNTKSIPS